MIKLKYLFVVFVSIVLVGCGKVSRVEANLTGHSLECISGVQYIQFPSGVTVSYNQEGKVKTC